MAASKYYSITHAINMKGKTCLNRLALRVLSTLDNNLLRTLMQTYSRSTC